MHATLTCTYSVQGVQSSHPSISKCFYLAPLTVVHVSRVAQLCTTVQSLHPKGWNSKPLLLISCMTAGKLMNFPVKSKYTKKKTVSYLWRMWFINFKKSSFSTYSIHTFQVCVIHSSSFPHISSKDGSTWFNLDRQTEGHRDSSWGPQLPWREFGHHLHLGVSFFSLLFYEIT